MRIRTRLLALVIGQLVLVVTVLLGLYLYTVSSKAHAQSVEKARSVIDLAEAVRDNMAEKWNLGVYQQEQLKEWAHNGNLDHVLATVPIVSAWKAVEDGAKKGGFEFKTPAERARNRANVADLVENEVLSKFRADKDLKEMVIPAPEKNAIRYFRPIRLTSDCLRCHGDPKTSEELWGNKEGFDATGTMMEGWKEGELHGAFEVTLSMEPAMVEARNEVLAGSAIVIALCTALAFAFSWVLHRQVTQPILEILTRLTARADQLKSASRLLNTTATQLTADAEECRSRSTTVAAAAEEMSVSVEQMAVSSEKLSDNVDTVDKAIMQLKSLASDAHSGVEEALRITGQAVTLTRESTEQIKSLGTAASEIDLVSKMIGDIAGQTNLLALNATIEAARAGTQGQGFAVVANEVKTLAQQTAKATQDIRRRIDAIQTATRTAVGSIQEVEEVINKVDSASQAIANTFEQQCQATEAIAQSVADANNYARALRQNTMESATATREVTSSIAVVDTRAQQNWSNARRTRQEGESLESIAGEIEQMTLSLKI